MSKTEFRRILDCKMIALVHGGIIASALMRRRRCLSSGSGTNKGKRKRAAKIVVIIGLAPAPSYILIHLYSQIQDLVTTRLDVGQPAQGSIDIGLAETSPTLVTTTSSSQATNRATRRQPVPDAVNNVCLVSPQPIVTVSAQLIDYDFGPLVEVTATHEPE